MAPGIIAEPLKGQGEDGPSYDVNLPYKAADSGAARNRTEFPEYLPSWDDKAFHDDPPAFEYQDPALRAIADMPNLLHLGTRTKDITPKMGTIVTGVNLKGLSDAAKDEIALLVTKRKIVVFREQLDFLQAGPGHQQKLMEYYGVPNIQPVTGAVKGHPGFHIIHRDNNQDQVEAHLRHKMTSTLWHQDVSYERQPPGYIMLGILACPDVGGDTVFADTTEAYR
jgi:sulfonate dioxygenase